MTSFSLSQILTLALVASLSSVRCKTYEPDIDVLRALINGIDPNTIPDSSYLRSWDFTVDPCESSGEHFLGILCTIPERGNESSRITTLDIDGMDYDGFLTKDIGNLTELVELNLSMNKFRGPIPLSVPNLKKLTRLDLSRNVFTGNILPGIKGLRRLQLLDLSFNRLTGTIPPWLPSIRTLTSLRLSNNAFSGKIPSLMGLWQLKQLDLSNNQFYGIIPQLPVNLETLSLSHNILSGHISAISRLQKLQFLDLSDNRLNGIIKSKLLALPYITRLNVSFNWLEAMEVPNLFGQPTLLETLDAQVNRLKGRLPANLVTISSLTTINLARNRYSGRIPSVYGAKLDGWKSLYLEYNFLVGEVPWQFENTTSIDGDLSKNCLNCPISSWLCRGGQRSPSECVGPQPTTNEWDGRE